VPVTKNFESAAHIELLNHLKEVRTEAIEHTRIARQLARERRRIMNQLIAEGFNQTDLVRELGVTRPAIQKMMAAGQEWSPGPAASRLTPIAAQPRSMDPSRRLDHASVRRAL
jgi:hypothetical protein